VNDLCESSEMTNITSVMKLSFGDLAASGSSHKRTSGGVSDVNLLYFVFSNDV